MLTPEEFIVRARAVRLLILDVDGVLSNGQIVVDERGRETKNFHVRDGFGIRCWRHAGLPVAVLTGRYSVVVAYRCRELGIHPVIQNAPNKIPAYQQLLANMGLTPAQVCYMGDDLPDLPLLLASGLGATVSDAAPEVRQQADWVSSYPGGHGATRELIEKLLDAQGRWAEVVEHYSRALTASW